LKNYIFRLNYNRYMTEIVNETISNNLVKCYLCELQIDKSKSMEIPLTTGGLVNVHPSCFDFYMSQTSNQASACGGCSGGKGCC